MSNPLPLHMRALIRMGMVSVFLADSSIAASMGDRIFPNRVEQWWSDELPAIGVYTLHEDNITTDKNPDPEERKLTMAVEALTQATERLDDQLDALALLVERAMSIDALGAAMTDLVETKLGKALPRNSDNRSPVDAALLAIRLTGTETGIAVDGERQIGVSTLTFDVEYQAPVFPADLDDFLLGCAGWDVAPADGNIEMQSRVEFPPAATE